MKSDAARRSQSRRGFTLTELMVVVGLIAVLISLVLPVVGRVRAAANSAACLSNLRQMTTAWNMYLTEGRGRLPDYVWWTPMEPNVAYHGYWPGVLEKYRVRGDALLCPAAQEPTPFSQNLKGAGNVNYAWNGKLLNAGSVGRLNDDIFRVSSYGYNRNLTAEGGYGNDLRASRISQIKSLSEVPVFFDSTYIDVRPANGTLATPAEPPDNLLGNYSDPGAPQHWRFLIARHGRAINIAFADGSARWVPLEETYMFRWNGMWEKYLLELPPF